MSRKWMQLLVLEALVLLVVVNLLPAWKSPEKTAWEPVVQWQAANVTPFQPVPPPPRTTAQVDPRRVDSIPAPPPPSYYAPRFEGAAPLANDTERAEYVRQRLTKTGANFGAVVNRTLRNSLPPEWDGGSLASNQNRAPRYAADNWPRR